MLLCRRSVQACTGCVVVAHGWLVVVMTAMFRCRRCCKLRKWHRAVTNVLLLWLVDFRSTLLPLHFVPCGGVMVAMSFLFLLCVVLCLLQWCCGGVVVSCVVLVVFRCHRRGVGDIECLVIRPGAATALLR